LRCGCGSGKVETVAPPQTAGQLPRPLYSLTPVMPVMPVMQGKYPPPSKEQQTEVVFEHNAIEVL